MLALPPHIYVDTSAVLPLEDIRLEEHLERLGAVAKDLMIRDERNCLSRSFLIVEELKKWRFEESKSTQSRPSMRSNSGSSNSDYDQQAPLIGQPYSDPGSVTKDQNAAIAEQSAIQLLCSEGSDPLFWDTELNCDWFLDDAVNTVDFDMPH
ncbi:hypothetical protein LEL_03960 [Akanthomyces lecanii RCEF 1005]|uniref:Uncharacterized protein n=1 Tax=Akanthomyces lecanii RCEF 1005 TaxID=1081108 RepID=A0A168GZW9_CORDF|nr:hypothetical protein LEL_03960 [Akanthomyces lecanii RCEF 1005]